MRIRRRPSLLVLAVVTAAVLLSSRTPVAATPGMRAAAAVSWPPSASLVISEVQTGGAFGAPDARASRGTAAAGTDIASDSTSAAVAAR